jgi:hypothetical protein
VHLRLTHRFARLDHGGALPVIEGTLVRLQVDHLPEPDGLGRMAWAGWPGPDGLGRMASEDA